MGMLDRYRKSGGFIQLLNVMETCGPTKQEKFLQIIREEDPRWADAIERKMLSIPKVFSWSDEALAEVAGNLQELTIAIAMHGLEQKHRDTLTRTMSHIQKRRIQELFDTSKPTPAEISAMMNKILEEVRKMITEGRLRMDKVDPDMVIDDDIEDQLKKGMLKPGAGAVDAGSDEGGGAVLNFDLADHMGGGGEASKEEVVSLRRKVMSLGAENSALKQEVAKLKSKLDQIKKMAA